MTTFGRGLIESGRSRFGKPFAHHFKPNQCAGGLQTTETCWDRGLDDSGYDCSGFVIASICDVLDLQVDEWPRDQRHIRQLLKTANPGVSPVVGDVVITVDPKNQDRVHAGIYTGYGRMLHADGRTEHMKINESLVAQKQDIRVLTGHLIGIILES